MQYTGMPENKHANPFHNLPEDKLAIIRDDFYESDISKTKSFEQYLKDLYEEDDLIPEEVLDVIEGDKTRDGKIFHTIEELLEDLHSDG